MKWPHPVVFQVRFIPHSPAPEGVHEAGRLVGRMAVWSGWMPKALSPVPPRVFLNACHVSSQAGSQCARHAALLASFLDTFSLLLIASGPLSHLVFCFLIQGVPLHLPLAQHSTSFTELSREVPRENGAGLLKGIHLCNEQCNVHIPAYLHRNLHTKATLQREGFFFFLFLF